MSAVVRAEVLKVGGARQFEALAARGGAWRTVEFPALCTLIRHPARGALLYDTGYSTRVFAPEAGLAARAYRLVLRPELPEAETLPAQLARRGLTPVDIRAVLVSHFHADHVAGLLDFPAARFVVMREDLAHLGSLGAWRAAASGVMPALLPRDLAARATLADAAPVVDLPRWCQPFERGHDLLGDGSVVAVPLPGHAARQMGLLLPDTTDGPLFLAADACWSLPACREGRLPPWLAAPAWHDGDAYRATFAALGALARRETALRIVPSHCGATWRALQQLDRGAPHG